MSQRVVEGIHHTRHSFHLVALHHDDVQNGVHTFGILTGSGVGDDLNALHHRGRHRLEYLLGILRQARVVVSVLVHAEARVALHRDVILSVHAHHWHLA